MRQIKKFKIQDKNYFLFHFDFTDIFVGKNGYFPRQEIFTNALYIFCRTYFKKQNVYKNTNKPYKFQTNLFFLFLKLFYK